MAFIKCSGGGKLKETVLWENPNPSKTFGNQNVDLNDDLTNYDYLKIYWYASRTNTTQFSAIVSIDDVISFGASGAVGALGIGGTSQHIRPMRYVNNTRLYFTGAIKNTGVSDNNQAIPVKLCDCKGKI